MGADQFGEVQKSGLAAAGVDVSGLRVSGTMPTGTAVIYVDEAGDNSIVVVAGANDECDIPYLEAHDALFQWCDYLLMQMEIPQDAILWAAKRAKELGKTVILNPAPAPDSISDELLSYIDYLTPNETELLKLADGEEADLIVGFPGETEEEFQQTLTFLHRCAFAAMHIFPYSKRPDTPAAKMPGQVLNAVKEERARRAAETAGEMEHTYLSQWVGQTVPVLFEEEQGGLWRGHTAHYCAVAAPSPRDLHNCLVQVQLEGLEGHTPKGGVL